MSYYEVTLTEINGGKDPESKHPFKHKALMIFLVLIAMVAFGVYHITQIVKPRICNGKTLLDANVAFPALATGVLTIAVAYVAPHVGLGAWISIFQEPTVFTGTKVTDERINETLARGDALLNSPPRVPMTP